MSAGFLRRHWFLAALVLTAALGLLVPEAGVRLRGSIAFFVAAEMLLSGFAIEVRNLLRKARDPRGMLIAFGSIYAAAPLGGYLAAHLLAPEGSGAEFLQAVMVLAAQAGTIASAIALTVMAGGSHELALLNTLLTSFSAVVMTPLILKVSLGAEVPVEFGRMLLGLLWTVILPVGAGLGARAGLSRLLDYRPGPALQKALRILAQAIILVFVLAGFAMAAPRLAGEPAAALRFLAAAALLHALLLAVTFGLSRLARLDPAARAATVLTGSQKTLTNGIYIADRFFPANPYAALPLVLHHMLQLVADTVLAGWMKKGIAPGSAASAGPTSPRSAPGTSG